MKKDYFLRTIWISAFLLFITAQLRAQTTCAAPIGLSVTNVSQTGAYLYLTPTSTNTGTFNIHYHGGTTTAWTTIEHVTLPYQLGGLSCGTTYEWQAQLICANTATGTTAVSDWSAGGTFTTTACTPPPTCTAPTGLSATNVSQTGAYLYLTPTSTNTGTFNIHYHISNSTVLTTVNNVTLPYQLGGLACGTTYEWQAQLVCANSATAVSDWSAGGTFTTAACTPPPTCTTPIGLSATNVSQTGAYLFLTPTSSNTGTFNIHYHGGSTTAWTTVEHVTLPYQLGGVSCGTTYEWQAQLICANTATGTTAVSDWSAGGTFTTTACTPPPTCTAPTGLSATNVTQTGAYLYLTPTSTNTGTFNIHYHTANSTVLTTVNNVTLPYQLGGLACGTAYEWQAQLVCSNATTGTTAVSEWSAGGTFTTLACTPPTCTAPTGLSATNVSQTGAYLYLTPTSSNTGTFNIHYHGGSTTSWTTVEHVTLPYQLGGLACGTTYEWQAQLICANTATGTTAVSDWSAGGTFTTAACTPPPTCNAPTGLSATNVSQTGAYLFLTPTSSNTGTFNIHYHGGSTTAWTTVEHVTLPYQLGGLSCGTTYEWQAQLICANTATGTTAMSDWSAGGTFTTAACTPPPTCNAPTGLSATNVSQTGAYLFLTPTSTNTGTFNIHYHGGTSTAWTTIEHVTLPYQLGGLSCGTTYEWQAQLICANTATGTTAVSDWSAGGTFTTAACTPPPTCNAPTGLSATNVSQTGAYLFLTPTSTNTGTFNIHYHGGSTTSWTTVEHVTLPYQLSGLSCGTTYEWQAQLICANTTAGAVTLSPWSAGGTFTTAACTPPPTCNAPTGLSATNVSQTGAYLFLTPTSSNTGTFNIHYHGGTSTAWTTIEHVTLPYQLGGLSCGTTYEWQAQLICANTTAGAVTLSPWSEGGTFTTAVCPINSPCVVPTELAATDIHQTSATLHWSAVSGAAGYIVYYKNSTSTSIPFITVTSGTNSITLSGLVSGSHYIWQVQTVCSNGTTPAPTSSLSNFAVFSTPAVSVFPNPSNQFVNLSFSLENVSKIIVSLKDSYGQEVYSFKGQMQEGSNDFQINTSAFSNGLYFLSLQTDLYSTTYKIIIAHQGSR